MFLRNLHKLNFISSYDEAFIAKHGCECCLAQPQLKIALELQFNGESMGDPDEASGSWLQMRLAQLQSSEE